MALANQAEDIIRTKPPANTLTINGQDFNLNSINIESIHMDDTNKRALVFKLLPKAKEHDKQELVRRYAAMAKFLEAA